MIRYVNLKGPLDMTSLLLYLSKIIETTSLKIIITLILKIATKLNLLSLATKIRKDS